MMSRQPFARRIVAAFVLMTAVVSGVFSLGIVVVVHFVEERLVTEEMHRQLHDVLDDLSAGRLARLGPKTSFYTAALPGYDIPERFAGVGEGFTEFLEGDHAFYVYADEINGRRYLLVEEQHEFEAAERILYKVVLAGFILVVLAAWGLGVLMARRIMAPVSSLAGQVQQIDRQQASTSPLAPQYPDDEVGQLAAAFDSTLGRLQQTLERERLFTSDVSHELRTPLMIIAGSCELLQQGDLAARQREQLQRIERAADEMHGLVQTFLQLARGNGRTAEPGAQVSLADAAEQAGRYWGGLIQDKGLAFACLVEGEDAGRYDAILLGTVLANLLRNALHYTEQGFVRLVLEAGGFRVEDSGSGIPEAQQESIFQPFVRGVAARGEGLGLGLSLVKRICTHQGWSIAVDKLSPSGSCFRVRFLSAV